MASPAERKLQNIAPARILTTNTSKFVCQNILFKFVLDFELKQGLWMYGGESRNDEYVRAKFDAVEILTLV